MPAGIHMGGTPGQGLQNLPKITALLTGTLLAMPVLLDPAAAKEAEASGAPPEEPPVQLNVGGWAFAVPRSKLAQFPESLLGQAAAGQRLFLDRDGYAFRHVHYFLHTARLSGGSGLELPLLYEQAGLLRLAPLLQSLDNLKEGKHNLRVRPADIPIAERASLNYWRTRKCISKPCAAAAAAECALKSPACSGSQEKAPLGLMDTPLLDTEDEVPYCFLPLRLVERFPALVTDDNLLWLADAAALIECESGEFRFIANFLRSEKILLPDNFSSLDALEAEAEALGIPKVIEAVKVFRNNPGSCSSEASKSQGCERSPTAQQQRAQDPSVLLPLYPMVLGLLVKYPDSALGQLHMESTLDGNKLYISGNGVLFQHVMNWLGTCRLPLTRNMSELPHLCTYLDQMDLIYEPMKDALKRFLNPKTPTDSLIKSAEWAAEITAFSLHHIVKVYVGSHWYATYLQTLLKFPELLSNCKKVYWIAYGQSLLIHGDGKMFRHVLNFLRLGKLYLPSEFKEWSLLCQEVIEYQIPSLLEALDQYDTYRLWVQQQEVQHVVYPVRNLESPISEKDTGSNEVLRDHLHFAVDLDQCANNWNIAREPQSMEGSDRENTNYTSISSNKGAKRKHPWEMSKSSEDWGNSCLFRQEGSPPKKRGAKGSLTKPLENSDPPIQKLISLVQGWDMAHCRCCGAPQGPGSGEESKWRALVRTPPVSCSRISSSELSGNELDIQGAPRTPGNLSKAGLCKQGPLPPQGWLAKADEPSCLEEVPFSGKSTCSQEQSGQKEKGTALEETAPCQALDVRGLILKVEHPPIVPCDGSCVFHEGSILYSTGTEDLTLACALAPPVDKDVVFLNFPLTQEEIFYAQKCHGFLTDVILDSIRQKDPKETTAKVELLVRQLWHLQITAKEFVAELLSSAPFKADGHSYEKLLKWVEFSLPFAWKYSCCVNLLIKKGYFKSLSHFVIEKYLQNP
ncbi:BTB/POZ domain-containing protein KCTD19 [Pituophis catenifer annectens]|uniref:BTB/POZ domain-containing protein KCTD19 n=1 Tax=Pituophis catenifer annectens TaxID=94852 RepID=UPI003995BE1D